MKLLSPLDCGKVYAVQYSASNDKITRAYRKNILHFMVGVDDSYNRAASNL